MFQFMVFFFFFFFNDTATTEIYTLSLHDALPICDALLQPVAGRPQLGLLLPDLLEHVVEGHHERSDLVAAPARRADGVRSEEHTSELQSRPHLVCRLLLEKKKTDQLLSTRSITVL